MPAEMVEQNYAVAVTQGHSKADCRARGVPWVVVTERGKFVDIWLDMKTAREEISGLRRSRIKFMLLQMRYVGELRLERSYILIRGIRADVVSQYAAQSLGRGHPGGESHHVGPVSVAAEVRKRLRTSVRRR